MSEIMKKKIYGIIYLIKNKLNNKIYIGQTTSKNRFKGRYTHSGNTLIERCYYYHLNRKESSCSYNDHLIRSIKKYGFDAFEVNENFDIAYSKEELDKLEDMYIKIYKATNKKYGYNNQTGGSNGKPTVETRNKQSEIRKGKFVGKDSFSAKKVILLKNLEIFDCMTDACKKYNISSGVLSNCCNGKLFSAGKDPITKERLVWMYYEEYINSTEEEINKRIIKASKKEIGKRISIQNKGKRTGKENQFAKKVVCITSTTIEMFDAVMDASKKYDINNRTISSCCNNHKHHNSCGRHPINNEPMVWMFYDDYINSSQDEINIKIMKAKGELCTRFIEIVGVTSSTIDIFKSLTDGIKFCGLSGQGDITSCCRDRQNSAGKHPITQQKIVWFYLHDIKTITKEKFEYKLNKAKIKYEKELFDKMKKYIKIHNEQLYLNKSA